METYRPFFRLMALHWIERAHKNRKPKSKSRLEIFGVKMTKMG